MDWFSGVAPGCRCRDGGGVLAMGLRLFGWRCRRLSEDSTPALILSKHILLGRRRLAPGEFRCGLQPGEAQGGGGISGISG